MEEFAYFMIRLHRQPATRSLQRLAGMVERLATGEKCSFTTGEELLRLINDWPVASPAIENAAPGSPSNTRR